MPGPPPALLFPMGGSSPALLSRFWGPLAVQLPPQALQATRRNTSHLPRLSAPCPGPLSGVWGRQAYFAKEKPRALLFFNRGTQGGSMPWKTPSQLTPQQPLGLSLRGQTQDTAWFQCAHRSGELGPRVTPKPACVTLFEHSALQPAPHVPSLDLRSVVVPGMPTNAHPRPHFAQS